MSEAKPSPSQGFPASRVIQRELRRGCSGQAPSEPCWWIAGLSSLLPIPPIPSSVGQLPWRPQWSRPQPCPSPQSRRLPCRQSRGGPAELSLATLLSSGTWLHAQSVHTADPGAGGGRQAGEPPVSCRHGRGGGCPTSWLSRGRRSCWAPPAPPATPGEVMGRWTEEEEKEGGGGQSGLSTRPRPRPPRPPCPGGTLQTRV